MAQAGEKVTFHVLFLDGLNRRMDVADPTIEVFTFDENGVRVDLVESGTDMLAVDDDSGRFSFTYPIPLDYNLGSRIYALMQATDPGSGLTILVEDSSDVYETGSSFGGSSRRMTSKFIK